MDTSQSGHRSPGSPSRLSTSARRMAVLHWVGIPRLRVFVGENPEPILFTHIARRSMRCRRPFPQNQQMVEL